MIRTMRMTFFGVLSLGLMVVSVPSLAQPQVVPFDHLVSKLHWRSIGPSVGGRVVAVSGVVQKSNVFYMGTVGGGIWKSQNYGVSWESISDRTLKSSNSSIGAIAVAPSDPNIIYAGTGEADIRNDLITGNGMYKSTDAGKNWKYIGLKDTHITSAIIVGPNNPNVVYVASLGHVFVDSNAADAYNNDTGGVYKTTDGGQTWKRVLFVNNKTGAIDLAMDPHNPQVLYAAMWQVKRTPWKLTSGGPESGLYKSTDGGAHWTNISHNTGMPSGILGRIGVAVAPSQPNIVYATIQADHGGLFRSENAGATWTRVNSNWELRQRGFYYSAVYVDPKDPNTIYMPEVGALWVSYDGGRKIGRLHTPHGDNHIAWINPSNPQIILEGNDGGATVSTDGGKTWSGEHDQPTGEFYHVNLDDQFPFHVYGAQQDEGSSEGPSSMEGGGIPLAAWHRITGGEASWDVPQPGKPWVTYGSGYYEDFTKENRKTGLTQWISPWPDYHDAEASETMKYRLAWTHPILFSPSNPQELLVGAQCVLKSMDYGETWNCISPDLTRNEKFTEGPTGGPIMEDETGAEVYPYLSGLAVSPLDNNIIWAGSSDGLVHVTTDDGQHWSTVTPPQLKQWAEISSIAPSYTDKGTAYLTASRYMWDDFKPYVYKTTDYGKHWTEITQGLPDDDYVMSVAIDPNNRNLIFLGVKDTVYVSVNGGNNWNPLTLNLPHAQVRSVAIQPEQNAVVIATHGRAFWVLDNLALLEQLADGVKVEAGSPHLFKPQLTFMTKAYGGRSFGGSSPSIGANHPFGTSVFFYLPAGYNGETPVTLKFTTASGEVVNTYKLHLKEKSPPKPKLPSMVATETTSATTPTITIKDSAKAEKAATAIEPGMNGFQWNLRYPGSKAVTGFYSGASSIGYDPSRPGAEILPGTYYAVLQYGNQTQRMPFVVKLDPRLTTTQSELAARQSLLFNITGTLNELTDAVNAALVTKEKLENRIKDSPGNRREQSALSNLNSAIGRLIQLGIQASEADSAGFPPALRGRLASLFMVVSTGYVAPSQLDRDVYNSLKGQIQAGVNQLNAVDRSIQNTLRQ